MSPFGSRIAALLLGTAMAGTLSVVAALILPANPLQDWLRFTWNEVFPDETTRLVAEAPPRNAAVRAEIERLPDHPWAGAYRSAEQWPDELALAPDAGF